MTLFQAFGQFAGSGAEIPAGWNLIKPSAVSVTGSGSESATIGAVGTVFVTSAETLAIEDVFSATYDSYAILHRLSNTASRDIGFQLRTGGVTATATNYSTQIYASNGSTDSAFRVTAQVRGIIGTVTSAGNKALWLAYLYNPFAAKITAFYATGINDNIGSFYETSGEHGLTNSYESVVIQNTAGGLFSGEVSIYGLRGTV